MAKNIIIIVLSVILIYVVGSSMMERRFNNVNSQINYDDSSQGIGCKMNTNVNNDINNDTNNANVIYSLDTANNVQNVEFDLKDGYQPMNLKVGVLVRLNIKVSNGSLNRCNRNIVMDDFGVNYILQNGDNIIEFTPTQIGEFTYTCGMGMLSSTITVTQ